MFMFTEFYMITWEMFSNTFFIRIADAVFIVALDSLQKKISINIALQLENLVSKVIWA